MNLIIEIMQTHAGALTAAALLLVLAAAGWVGERLKTNAIGEARAESTTSPQNQTL